MLASRAARGIVAAVAATAAAAVAAPAALALPDGVFNCRASTVQVNVGSQQLDPIAVPDSAPCANDEEGVADDSFAADDFDTSLTTRAAYATSIDQAPPNRAPRDGDGVAARAGIAEIVLERGTDVVRIQNLNASASATCQAGAPVFSGASSVGSIVINGESRELPEDDQAQDIPIGPLTLHLNESATTATTLVRAALRIETEFGEIFVGRAAVGVDGLPCQDDGNPGPGPQPGPTQFACRGSAERITPAFFAGSEPVVANALFTPCKPQTVGTRNVSSAGVTVRENYAFTRGGFVDGFAKAGAQEVVLATQPNQILIDGIDAEAFIACKNGAPFTTSGSRIGRLQIGTQTFQVGNATFRQSLGVLGTLWLNTRTPSATTLTRRAVWLQSTTFADVVVGEAKVGIGNTTC